MYLQKRITRRYDVGYGVASTQYGGRAFVFMVVRCVYLSAHRTRPLPNPMGPRAVPFVEQDAGMLGRFA
jgi:hypothetical protein